MEDLISIIVPIYGVEKYLNNCVQSLLKQSYKNIEIILVDDGSKDNCPEICDYFGRNYKQVVVIHKENGGLSSARNVGLDSANGKYIVFVDSDDTVELDYVKDLYNCMKRYNCELAACGRNYVFENGKTINKVKNQFSKKFDFYSAMIEMNKFDLFDMSAWGKIYNKDFFDDIRFPVGKLSEDFFIMYRLIEKANEIAYTSKPLYNYLQRKCSISRNKKINHDFIEAAKEQMEYIENKYEYLKGDMRCFYVSSILTVVDFYIKNNVIIDKMLLKQYKKIVKGNIKYINNNKNIGFKKKIQIYLFSINYKLYKFVFKRYRSIKIV